MATHQLRDDIDGRKEPYEDVIEDTQMSNEKFGTTYDRGDMDRMGKLQQLRVSLSCSQLPVPHWLITS